MSYTADDAQRLFKLLGQAVWYTQHLELVVTQYNSLMTFQKGLADINRLREDDVRKMLSTKKTQPLEPLFISMTSQDSLPDRLQDRFRIFIKTRSWILHECLVDERLSFKEEKSQQFFYGLIAEYIEEAIALKSEIFNEMEAWLKANGYDLDRVYPLSGGVAEEPEQ